MKKVNPKGSSTLEKYGHWEKSWRSRIDMDRFLVLVFLTADEKLAFARDVLGVENQRVVYIDGAGCRLKVKPRTKIE
jgi:hypothetical protein